MKNNRVGKLLAWMLSCAILMSNIFAADVALAAEQTEEELLPIVETLFSVAGEDCEWTQEKVHASGNVSSYCNLGNVMDVDAVYYDTYDIRITYPERVAAKDGKTEVGAVSGSAVVFDEKADLQNIFTNPEVTIVEDKAVLTISLDADIVERLKGNSYDLEIPEGYVQIWNGSTYVDSREIQLCVSGYYSSYYSRSTSYNQWSPILADDLITPDEIPSTAPEIVEAIDKAKCDIDLAAKYDFSNYQVIIDAALKTNVREGQKSLTRALMESSEVLESYRSLEAKVMSKKNVMIKEPQISEEASKIVSTIEAEGLGLNQNNMQAVGVGLVVMIPKEPVEVTSQQDGQKVTKSEQIYISRDGFSINTQWSGSLTHLYYPIILTLDIPETYDNDTLRIYRYNKEWIAADRCEKSVIEVITPERIDGKAVFAVYNLGTFAFVNTEPINSDVGTDDSSDDYDDSSSNTGSSSSGSAASTAVRKETWGQDTHGWRYRNADGSYAVCQWKLINNVWYFFDADSYMAEGWKQIDGKWYYLALGNGGMLQGWQMIDGKWYYMTPDNGGMVEGWKQIDGKWYYLNPGTGDMAEGWKQVDGKWYYLSQDGSCLMNGMTPDGFQVDSTGAWIQ